MTVLRFCFNPISPGGGGGIHPPSCIFGYDLFSMIAFKMLKNFRSNFRTVSMVTDVLLFTL